MYNCITFYNYIYYTTDIQIKIYQDSKHFNPFSVFSLNNTSLLPQQILLLFLFIDDLYYFWTTYKCNHITFTHLCYLIYSFGPTLWFTNGLQLTA